MIFPVLTTTTTIIGWNVPDVTNLTNGIFAFLVPMAVMGLTVTMANLLGNKGSSNTFLMKFGLFVGCLLGMLSLNASAANVIPLALPIVAGIYLVTYLWKGV